MTLAQLAVRNVRRNLFRTFMTVLGVAVALLTFTVLRTVIWAWSVGVEAAAKDRVGTRHKVTFIMPLPKKYIDDIRGTPGVVAATWANWFGGKDPRHEREFFATMAVDTASFFTVMDEMRVEPADMERWKQDRKGAIIGDVLARKLGWKVGDKVTLSGTIFPGDWEFQIDGIYSATRKSVDRSQFIFHWAYLNESLPERGRDQIGWVISRVRDAGQTAQVAASIDRIFDEKDVQTLSMSERSMANSFLGMVSAVFQAIDVVSGVILVIMLLILGNTIAMGVRERTGEYGVLRAIGFLPRHLALLVLGEGLAVGALGGVLGLWLAWLVVGVLGRWIEENMGAYFPYFRLQGGVAAMAMGISMLLSTAAAALPAYRASRLRVIEALRRTA